MDAFGSRISLDEAAAAYATSGVLGWERNLRDWRFRSVWAVIVVAGTTFAFGLNESPVRAIVFAQAANGLLLPLIAIFLLVVMNRKELLGDYTNGVVANLLGVGVVLIATALGGFQLLKALGVVF
jgi:manganese transport protein